MYMNRSEYCGLQPAVLLKLSFIDAIDKSNLPYKEMRAIIGVSLLKIERRFRNFLGSF